MKSAALKKILAVFLKDVKSEFRTRYAVSSQALFVLTAIATLSYATRAEPLGANLSAGLLWTAFFFGASTSLSKVFVGEEERSTSLALKIYSDSTSVFFGKLLYNIVLCLLFNALTIFLFQIFVDGAEIKSPGVFAAAYFFGSVGLAGASTIISAIISKANSKNALFPVLSFPLILPLVMSGIGATAAAYEGAGISDAAADLNISGAYCVVVVTASYLLFDFVWKD